MPIRNLELVKGQRIVDVVRQDEGSDRSSAVMLILENGTLVIPMEDPEGNGPGSLHLINSNSPDYLSGILGWQKGGSE